MSELTAQQGIQTVIRAISAFKTASVVINDWSKLDGTNEDAPFVIISNADEFNSRQDTVEPETTWQEVVDLYERFVDYPTTLNNFRARRQAIIDEFNEVGSNRSLGLAGAVTADEIRSGGPITPYYGPYVREEDVAEAIPVFLMQRLLITVQEY